VTHEFADPSQFSSDFARPLPPAEPPPSPDDRGPKDPAGSLFDRYYRPISLTSVQVDLSVADCQPPYFTDLDDSVTHVICAPRVCGLHGDPSSSVKFWENLVDGGSNICVTGDLGILLDVADTLPGSILVAIEGMPVSLDDCITKRGLLPLTMADGSSYYQP
jgi:hypothetical protein